MAHMTGTAYGTAGRDLVLVGGGPRAAMLLERLAANAPLLAPGPVHVHLVEPFSPGSGRIWRREQSPLLKLNSMAQDVTLFTDDSVECAGPAQDGPSLTEWRDAVLDGRLADVPPLDEDLRHQLQELGPQDFPTRRLHSVYLEWFFQRTVARLGDHLCLTVHQDTAVGIHREGTDRWRVQLAGGTELGADAVVVAVGHTESTPPEESARFACFAAAHAAHGVVHVPPAYTNDVDLAVLQPGEDVIVAGMGLAFIDLMVLVMEGRGGSFHERPDGRLLYRPSGLEPRLWVGSRRGVPYHSKIRGGLKGLPAEPPRFLTRAAVDALRDEHGLLDFATHLWPLMAKDMAYAYYRELVTGHPERVRLPWTDFSERFAATDWYSDSRRALVAGAVPDHADRLEFEDVNRPFHDRQFSGMDEVQRAITGYISRDLDLRDSGQNSETLGLFLGVLGVYMELGRVLPLGALTPESRSIVSGWWHGFFSFVDSGPPAHRLRELLALHETGLVRFLGPGLEVGTDEQRGVFTAASSQSPVRISARALVEARLPAATLTTATEPLLRQLKADGIAVEDPAGSGKMLVDPDQRVVTSGQVPADRLFAVGAGTTGWGQGAFARPRSNAAPFRDTDALARTILTALAGEPERPSTEDALEVPDLPEDEMIARIAMAHSSVG
ncbi:FAD/NAD(P)-binding domain-containing protein [Citricoccus sp.]|uniref:FAD/NAD(P)-binding protein n=1 Tax=Citricoccus sp. TaxID=1978372 RepID=UPI00262D77FE|nr:FAD/NAD(P)-binding protein [Citricoccus sp.]HRO94613.1 FAD/NAD(P)-binding protein [Citricoccus sp.]